MKIVVLVAIAAGLVGIPAVAIAQLQQPESLAPKHTVSVTYSKLGPAMCADAKQMFAARGLAPAHPCRVTSVMEQWESGVGDSPKAVSAQLAARGCNVFKRASCPVSVARDVRWHFNECFGMFDHCTKHDSPVWWKVQQGGRYYKGWPCRYSSTIPGPYNCKRYYTWTRDHTWRWHHYHPPKGTGDGFHRCNSVSGSGASTSIDSCYRLARADPSGTPRKFPYSKSGHGKVGMVFTACGMTQCRTYRVPVGLHPGAKGARRGA